MNQKIVTAGGAPPEEVDGLPGRAYFVFAPNNKIDGQFAMLYGTDASGVDFFMGTVDMPRSSGAGRDVARSVLCDLYRATLGALDRPEGDA